MPNTRDIQPPESKHGERAKPRIRSPFSGPITFAIAVVAIIFIMSVTFRVYNIEVEGNVHYTDEQIIKAVDIEQGDNLFFFDRFAAVSRVFAKLPYVEQVSVRRSLPNKVVISITESTALAYLQVGDEKWTLDHKCKVLGKAADGEEQSLICVSGIDPGTLLIGELLTVKGGDTAVVDFLADVLSQLQDRGLASQTTKLDFSDVSDVSFQFGERYTVKIGASGNVEYKMGMFVTALSKLQEGDVGVIDVSDGATAHFMPR